MENNIKSSDKIKFTIAQEQVIAENSQNLLVSASAGSGKTATIIEKIAREIKDEKVKVDELLVVTFTEAASLEMKTRLYNKLVEYAEDSSVVRESLQKISTADISTLHSFCAKVIRQNFYAVNLNPSFSVLPETDSKLLKAQALDKVINNYVRKDDKEFVSMCEMFDRDRTNSNLKNNVLSLYNFLCAQEDKEKFVNEIALSCYEGDLNKNPAVIALNKKIISRFAYIKKLVEKSLVEAEQISCLVFVPLLENILGQLILFNSKNTFEENLFHLSNFNLPRMVGKVDDEFLEFKEGKVALWGYIKAIVANFKNMCGSLDVNEVKQRLITAGETLGKLLEATENFSKEYSKLKKQRNTLDFNDLEYYCIEVLKNENLRMDISKNFKKIFVDEYQDINPIQEKILQMLSLGNNMVMVGDIKQSIYGFRNSTPQIFMGKKEIYEKVGGGKVVKLNENFRSDPVILNFVNDIFKVCMTETNGGVNYLKDGMLKGESKYETCNDIPKVTIKIIDTEEEKEEKEIITNKVYSVVDDQSKFTKKLSESVLEARLIADSINKIIGKKIYDIKSKSEKEVTYRDITIMCRTNTILKEICQELTNCNIPVLAKSNENLYKNSDVMFLVSLLKLVNNPHDDISLVTVLSNPIFKISYDDLAQIKVATDCEYFYLSVNEYLQNNDNDLCAKLNKIFEVISKAREKAYFSNIYEILQFFEHSFGFLNYYLSLPNGRKRHKTITQFINHFLSAGYNDNLVDYIDYVDNFASNAVADFSVVSSDNCVKIETIHASKGLEYPIVFLAGCGANFSKMSFRDDILKNSNMGLGVDCFELSSHTKSKTLARAVIADTIREEEAMEEMRLLYVALTRAKNHLFIIGDLNTKNLLEVNETSFDAKSYLDWIVGALKSTTITGIKNCKKGVTQKITGGGELIVDTFNKLDFLKQEEVTDIVLDLNIKNKKYNFEEYFDYVYKNQKSTEIAEKNTVTNVVRENELFEAVNYEPTTLSIKENQNYQSFDWAKVGTCYHNILQIIPFDNVDLDYIKNFIEKQKNLHPEDGVYYDKVDANKIKKAIETINDLKYRTLIREKRFIMYIPHNRIVENSTIEDRVLIQGIVDLIVMGENKNIIIDYKTTKVDTADQLVEKYGLQLKLYKQAIEGAMGIKVDEMWVYSLFLDKLVKID